ARVRGAARPPFSSIARLFVFVAAIPARPVQATGTLGATVSENRGETQNAGGGQPPAFFVNWRVRFSVPASCCSPTRTRTWNKPVTPALTFPRGVDYLITPEGCGALEG